MRLSSFALIVVCLAAAAASAGAQSVHLDLPTGPAPTIDGSISEGEWTLAVRLFFAPGADLLLMSSGDYVYIAVQGVSSPVTSVCVDRGGQTEVMHSSAALGTAVFSRAGDAWDMTRPFLWQCRETSNSTSAIAARQSFLQNEGWVGSNGRLGARDEVEYQVHAPLGTLRISVSSLGAPRYDTVFTWPPDVTDDSHMTELLTGPIPDRVSFLPETWAELDTGSHH